MARLFVYTLMVALLGGCVGDDDTQQSGSAADQHGQHHPEEGLTLTLHSTEQTGLPPLMVDFSYTLQVNGVTHSARSPTVNWLLNDVIVGTEDTWRHTFVEAGSFDVRLEVRIVGDDGEVYEASAVTVVTVDPCVDLSVAEIMLDSPTEIAPGDTLRLERGALINVGAAIPETVIVHAVISTDDTFEPTEDTVVAIWNFNGIPEGEFVPHEASLEAYEVVIPSDVEEGLYWLFIVADPLGKIPECDEDNNHAPSINLFEVSDALLLKPDLTADGFVYAQQGAIYPGETLNYTFTIKNIGEGQAVSARFSTHLSSDGVFDPDDDLMLSGSAALGSSIPLMEPQDSQNFLLTYQVPEDLEPGSYWLIVVVDLEDEVVETDETNNVLVAPGPFSVVSKSVSCADLQLQALNVSPPITYWQGTVRVEAVVINAGAIPIPDGWDVGLYVSLQPAFNPDLATKLDTGGWSLPAIEGFGAHVIDELVTIPPTLPVQSHYIWLVLDPADDYPECSESNNALMFDETIQIQSASSVELMVSDVGFHPAVVEVGEEIKVGFKLHNMGSSQASSFYAAVVLSEDSELSYTTYQQGQEHLIHQFTVPFIGAGETLEWVEKVIIPIGLDQSVTAPYTLGVIADPDNSQPSDTNKNNNADVASLQLSVSGAQGGCQQDALFEPNDTFAEAIAMTSDFTSELTLCGDDDWFVLDLPAGHGLALNLNAQPVLALGDPGYNLDLEVYQMAEPAPTKVASSTYLNSTEQLSLTPALDDRQVFIRVYAAEPGHQAHYVLTGATSPPHVGIDLMPQGLSLSPTSLYPGGFQTASWSDVNLGSTSAESYDALLWLSLDQTLDEGDTLLTTLTGLTLPSASAAQREVAFVVPDSVLGGTYRVLVQLDEPDFGDVVPSNNLTVSDPFVLDPALTCAEDTYEPNDLRSYATELELNGAAVTLTDLAVCPGLEDWFYLELTEGQSLQVSVNYAFEADRGLVLVGLYDASSQSPLLSDAGLGVSEINLPWTWSPGSYYIRISTLAYEGSESPYDYSLTVGVNDGVEEMACKGDEFEDNSATDTAAQIGCGTQHATLCAGDVDVYRLDLGAEQTLTVTLEHEESALGATLYDVLLGDVVAEINSNGQLLHYSEVSTLLYLEVQRSDPTADMEGFDYSLTLDGLGGSDLSSSALSVHPPLVVQGEDVELSYVLTNSCVDTTLPFQTTIWLSQDEALDVSDVDLATVAHPFLTGFEAEPFAHKVSVPASTAPGPYWLILETDSFNAVQESNELNNTGAIALSVVPQCSVDSFEPNDILGTSSPWAPAVGEPGAADLAICPEDVDWFSVAVPAGIAMTAAISFSQAEGDLDLRLYDPTFSITQPIASSLSSTDNESLQYTPATGADLLLRVNGFDGASAAYGLSISLN